MQQKTQTKSVDYNQPCHPAVLGSLVKIVKAANTQNKEKPSQK